MLPYPEGQGPPYSVTIQVRYSHVQSNKLYGEAFDHATKNSIQTNRREGRGNNEMK
jgi:hypothetical protein